MATYDLTTTTPSQIQTGDIINCPYSGNYKTITLKKGTYKLEVWGAEGGYRSSTSYSGKGGYSYGTITLPADATLYLYAGGAGGQQSSNSYAVVAGGFNGGGYRQGYRGGGGGSDIRINSTSLYARVIVAGGGGSDGASSKTGMYGGGTSGGASTQSFGSYGYGGSQTGFTTSLSALGSQPTTNSTSNYPGGFGFGGFGVSYSSGYGGAGGGGWYGGCGVHPDGSGDDDRGGGGGSGYVYTSSTASSYPSGCLLNSSYYLTSAATVAGNTSFTSPTGSAETGHSGHGYVRITAIDVGCVLSYDPNGGTGGPTQSTAGYGETITLPTTVPTKDSNITSYTVSFYNNETLITTLTPNAIRSFAFASWNTQADGKGTSYLSGSQITVNDDMTLYAQYTSSLAPASIAMPSCDNYSEQFETVIKLLSEDKYYTQLSTSKIVDYYFENWNTKKDGTGDAFAVGNEINVNKNTKFYAQFLSVERYIPIALPTPSLAGKEFMGWYSPRTQNTYEDTFTPMDETFLYAMWKNLESNGSYDLNIYNLTNSAYDMYEGYIYKNGKWIALSNYIYPWPERGNTWNDTLPYTWNSVSNLTWTLLREGGL